MYPFHERKGLLGMRHFAVNDMINFNNFFLFSQFTKRKYDRLERVNYHV